MTTIQPLRKIDIAAILVSRIQTAFSHILGGGKSGLDTQDYCYTESVLDPMVDI